MATVFTPLYNSPDDQQNDQKQIAGQLSSASGAAGGGQTTPANPLRQGSGQAPNLQSYINANLGGGQQIAEGIQNNLQNQTDQFNQNVSKTQNELEGKSKPLEDELGGQAKNLIQTSFKDPQTLLKQQQQLQEFQRLRDQGANGEIDQLGTNRQQSINNLNNQFNNIQSSVKNSGTEQGQFQLLQQVYGNPQYTSGQQRLDQLLLQAQPNASRSLQQNLQQMQQSAQPNLQNLDSSSQARLSALKNLSSQNANDIQNVLKTGTYDGQHIGSGFDDINQNVQKEIAAGNTAAADQPRLLAALQHNTGLTPDDLQKLGLGGTSNVYNLDLGKYFTQNQMTKPNAADVASNDEIQRFHSLQQLAGGNAPADVFGGQQENTGWKPYGFNNDQFNQDLSGTQSQYTGFQNSLAPQGDATQALVDMNYNLSGANGAESDYDAAFRGSNDLNSIQGVQNALSSYEHSVPQYVLDQYRNATGMGAPGYRAADDYRKVYQTLQNYYGLKGNRTLNDGST